MMSTPGLNMIILGLSITSSWGNGHATTYRGLVRELVARGHCVLFLERDVPWYAAARDLPVPPYGHTVLYTSLEELQDRFTGAVQGADVVIVGSYVPEGVAVGEWVTRTASGVTAFYDIDTPITVANLRQGNCEYLSTALIPCYDLYLSFTGGPLLQQLEHAYGARMARPLYCSADATLYYPERQDPRYDLGYMGTYSADRQPALERLLLEPAQRWRQGRFVVAGAQYPAALQWPDNVERIEHLPPAAHRDFYNVQRFTLNITRADMLRTGYAPSVRLFEAAACATPIISDYWPGLESFFSPGQEILISQSPQDTLRYLHHSGEAERHAIGARARRRVLAEHTAVQRAETLERYVRQTLAARRAPAATLQTHFTNPRTPLELQIAELGPWFHNLHLADGSQTAPNHPLGDFPAFKWQQITPYLPQDLRGWRVLDIGCNAGFYSFALARRGAAVTGIDADPHYLRQAHWAAAHYNLAAQVRFLQQQVYDLASDEDTYDLVLFMGVFYHLRYPLLALDIVAKKVNRLLVFQTLTMPGEEGCAEVQDCTLDDRAVLQEPGWPKMAFIEHRFAADPSNWWIPNHAAVEAMLRSSGLRVVQRPGHEIYLCQPDATLTSATHDLDVAQFMAATGSGQAERRR